MAYRTKIVNPLDQPGWDDLLMAHKDSTFFHTAAWARVLHESYGYDPTYFAIMDGPDLLALIPLMEVRSFLTGRRGVSLPFSDHCEPLVMEPVSFPELFDHVVAHGKRMGWKYLQLRGVKTLLPDCLPSALFVGHTLKLDGNVARIRAGFRDSTRGNIRKAIAQDVEVKISNSTQAVKEFYRLNCLTRRAHGLPSQPYNFFEKLHEYVIAGDLGFVALASFQGRVIAGAIYLLFGSKVLYKYGAFDKAFQHLRPNNLVMWEAIRKSCREGYQNFDFGISARENTGLLQFKRGWGASEYPINYCKYDFRQSAFIADHSKVTGWHNSIFRRMPIPLLKLAGSMLYRHAG